MIVNRLELDFFRNYVHEAWSFSPRINVIYGENAQGKTNLLEAVAYLSTASSYRARYERELIQFGVDHAFLKAEVEARERTFELEARLSRGARRQLFSNGVRLRSAGELLGILHTVLFSPEHLSLIRDGPAARRRFLDECICQLRPRYAAALTEYRRLLEQKSCILKECDAKPSLLDTLDDFNLRMAQMGAILIHYRSHFIEKLGKAARQIHLDFSGGREELALGYSTVSTLSDPMASPREILPRLLEHQESHRRAELESRQCLSGPHKDDLEVSLGGKNAKAYGSQGQVRTAALSLKLAARELFWGDTGEWPVLLLDDVLSELDERRRSFVLERIQGGQVFITCCEAEAVTGLKEGKSFLIREGKVVL